MTSKKLKNTSSDNFRANIRRLMEVWKLSHSNVAELVGCTRPNITQLLNGSNNSITLSRADFLAESLGVRTSDLIESPSKFAKIKLGKKP